ncbi:MAG: PqqD family protein [Solirubrobacteraceae bacterium]
MSNNASAPVIDATVRIPNHVVYRSFVQETVVLNLETGRYHGLNRTAGAMLSALEAAGSIRSALQSLAETFPDAGERLEHDLLKFCENAQQRRLIELTEIT